MKSWYHLIKGAVSLTDCAELCAYASAKPPQQGTVGHGGKEKSSVHEGIRRSPVRWLDREDEVIEPLCDLIERHSRKAARSLFDGMDIRSFGHLQYTEYRASEQGHYDWHQDNNWTPEIHTPYDRKLSVCLLLSPPGTYEGGEFWINPGHGHQTVKDYCEAGDLILFPSHLWHRVAPVTAGVRISLVTWWEGPRFR